MQVWGEVDIRNIGLFIYLVPAHDTEDIYAKTESIPEKWPTSILS